MFKTFLNKVRKEKKSLENKNKFLNADDNNNNDDDDDDNGYDEGCCHAERDKQAKVYDRVWEIKTNFICLAGEF